MISYKSAISQLLPAGHQLSALHQRRYLHDFPSRQIPQLHASQRKNMNGRKRRYKFLRWSKISKYDKAILSLCRTILHLRLTSLRLRIASATIKVQYPLTSLPGSRPAMMVNSQLAWNDNRITPRSNNTRISRADVDNSKIRSVAGQRSTTTAISNQCRPESSDPRQGVVYQVCDGYDFCEASPQVIIQLKPAIYPKDRARQGSLLSP